MQPWQPHLTLNWFTNQSLMAVFASGNEILKFGAFIVSLATIGLLFTRAWKCRPRNTLLIGLFIPPLVMSIVSFAWNNIIVYRALMPGLFILALWFGWEFGSHPTSAYRLSMAFVWTLLLAFGLSLWHPSDRGGQLDQVAGSIRSQWRTGDLLVYETQTTALPFQYYLSDLPHYYWMNTSNILLNEPGVPRINTGDMTSARRIWLVTVEDILIKPAERDQVRAAFPTRALQWKIHYIQASTIDVWMIEN